MESQVIIDEIHNTEIEYNVNCSSKPLCGICGDNHLHKECNILQVTNHVRDKVIPSKARLTLPDTLEIRKLVDGTSNIYTKCLVERGTQFGPFQAKKLFTLHPSIEFPLKIFTNGDEDLSEYFLDTSDENECNWMIFIGPASEFAEQNTICYQEGEYLYYATIRDVQEAEPLKVWYSPYYALKMKKEILNVNNSQENISQTVSVDVEAILKKQKNITPRDSWSCKFCGKVEKDLSVFAFHLLDHYRSQMSRVCTICKESFQTRQQLNKHLKVIHGNNTKKTIEIIQDDRISVPKVKDVISKEMTSVGGPLLMNDIIPDSLDNSSLFLPQTDISQFDLSSIENQNMLLENENLNLNMENILTENVKGLDHFNFDINEPESEQLVCDICLKSFLKLKSLIQHLDQHTGKFLCHTCNTVFARKENLVHHSCNSFYKEECPLCKRIFFQKKYLTQHMNVMHNKQFACDKCHKSFYNKKRLESHDCPFVPIVKVEKFPCTMCPKIFFKKWSLEEHIKRHKRIKKNSQYICTVCSMILQTKSSYFKHAKLHDGQLYTCDICHKHFKRSDTLGVHKKRAHSVEEKEEICEICSKKLKSKKLLNIHMEIHKKNKPYKCNICHISFTQRSNLTRHTNKHKLFNVKLDSLFGDKVEVYQCPKCNKNMKLKSSLQRHMKVFHPDDEITYENMKPKLGKLVKKLLEEFDLKTQNMEQESEDNESELDLKQTIENMNFNTDEVNCSENNDINIEIDKILNNADNIDHFLNESSDQIVERLINTVVTDEIGSVSKYVSKEVCLSMPDLSENDLEIRLSSKHFIQ